MENASATSPTPHFFQPLLPGFHTHLNIPIAFFSKHIKGTTNEGNAVVKLRSDASDITWEVKMDGRRLTQGWQNFATSHDLRLGDVVVFRHDGDSLFHVTCLGPSCCEIQYDNDDDDDDDDDSELEKYQHTREAGSSSDDSCFVTRACHRVKSKKRCTVDFSRSNGLMNRQCEIILLNEDGVQWRLLLNHHKTQGLVYIRRGWRSFCRENKKGANGFLTFKLVFARVQARQSPSFFIFISNKPRQILDINSHTTPYNLKKFKLANGIENARKMITLVDRYGIKRTTTLKPDNKHGIMRLGKEWREFCEVNGVKVGESFKMEIIYLSSVILSWLVLLMFHLRLIIL